MSFTSIISEQELEELANNIFRQLPNENGDHDAKPVAEQASIYQAGKGLPNEIDQSDGFDMKTPQTSLQDPFLGSEPIPKAVSGDGRSPGGFSDFNPEKPVQSFEQVLPPIYSNERSTASISSNGAFDHGSEKQNPNNFNPWTQQILPFQNVGIPEIETATKIYQAVHAEKFVSQLPEFNSFASNLPTESRHFDVHAVRKDFPILNEHINGRKLVWFDNAATTQKPQHVIDRLTQFYRHENSNIHRAAHALAARATDAYEEARNIVKQFLNAKSANEIVFTRGTTESINLVASSWGDQHLKEGDRIIISHLEHHANIVPWQLLSRKKGFKIDVIPVNDQGELLLDSYANLLNDQTKLVSFTHVSNALGTITPAKKIIDLAHQAGAKVLLDGAQSVSHLKVDLQDLNPDFFVFSGHKIFGPTGIGVLYAREELLNSTQPYQGGGNMIKDVTFERTLFQDAPNRFEAGTGNIADAVGHGAALRYVDTIGLDCIAAYEHALLEYGTKKLNQIPGLKFIGTAKDKASVLSFTLNGISNDDVGKALNQHGIAVRTGHHCAQPILRRLGYETCVRPSLAFYNTFEEIDLLQAVLSKLASGAHGRYW